MTETVPTTPLPAQHPATLAFSENIITYWSDQSQIDRLTAKMRMNTEEVFKSIIGLFNEGVVGDPQAGGALPVEFRLRFAVKVPNDPTTVLMVTVFKEKGNAYKKGSNLPKFIIEDYRVLDPSEIPKS